MPRFSNIAAYKFAPLTDIGPLRGRLLGLCKSWSLRGTILLSPEGINLFVAGAPENFDRLLVELRSIPGLADLEVKISESDHQPFNRMLVRLKKEIIAFGIEGIAPGQRTSPKLPPKKLKEWLDEGKPIMLLDTRNDYEVKLGTFKNALPIGVDHFRDFPAAVRKLPEDMKEQPIVMFCTGGIRCEKAGPFMEREGFKNIFQLDGGILKYFEECGGAHYDGECFVFDQRVGVDPSLHETDSTQCFVCLTPISKAEQEDSRYVAGKSCPHCFKTAEQAMTALIAKRHAAIQRAISPLPGSTPYDNFRPINVPEDCDGATLLDALCRVVRHIPREEWKAECSRDLVLNHEHKPCAADQIVRAGERFLHKFPNVIEPAVNGNIQVLHEDEAIIVLNKPAPLPMHAGGRFNRNTLQHILNEVYHPEKPKQAHRLDANTTGIVLLTRTRHFAALLQPQFARGEVEKYYLVKVQGHPTEDTFSCDAPISAEPGEVGTREIDFEAGLPSHTDFRMLKRNKEGTALLEARPLTGRTNQIRVHLWHLGLSVCGDAVYLPGKTFGTTQTLAPEDSPLCLHAWRVRFVHPLTKKSVEFSAPVPGWAELVEKLPECMC
jgi:RluA family pseudouridine synthase